MIIQNFKKYVFAMALGVGFVTAPALSGLSTVQAQDYPRRQNRRDDVERRVEPRRNDGNYGPVDRNGNIDLNRNGIDDRYETRDGRVDINQNGIADQDENLDRRGRDRGYHDNGGHHGNRDYGHDGYYGNRDYGNGGYFGNRGYGNNNAEFQKGYSDGLSRGRDDALTNRAMDPNNSSHYRSGNPSYRAGFERGFFEAYRQYRNPRW